MKNQNKPAFPLRPLVLAASLVCASGSCAAADMDNLDTINGSRSSEADAISADGSIIVGSYRNAANVAHAYQWKNGVMTDLQPSEPTNFTVRGVSYDGSVIVGSGTNAFRYQNGTFTTLNPFGSDAQSIAQAVSGDGNTVVGQSCPTSCVLTTAAVWRGGGTTAALLPNLPSQFKSQANAVNQDGTVIVGLSQQPAASRAAYWINGIAYDLGTLFDSPTQVTTNASATGVSADGKTVVGNSEISPGGFSHATLWNVPTPTAPTATDLGTLTGTGSSHANGISSDGLVVVGQSDFVVGPATGQTAFRWTQATGMQSIPAWLNSAGVSMPAGWTLSSASATNQDGSVVIGTGTIGGRQEAWLARVVVPAAPPSNNGGTPGSGSGSAGNGSGGNNGGTPGNQGATGTTPGSGLIAIADYNGSVVEAAARAVQAGIGMPNLTMFGAHHRSILDSGLARNANGICAWATADASGDNRSDTHSEITEAGICKDIGATRIGLGVGQAWSQQDLSLNGSARYNGRYLILEAANAFENGLQPSVTAYYGNFNTSMDRHYMNGAAIDSSNARPKARSYAMRARLDWKNAGHTGRFELSPYAAYTWMRTRLDAYTETGGGFPARFDASSWSTSDLRIGNAARTALSASTDLRLGLEAVHRIDGSTNGVNGQVLGLWTFSVPGQSTNETWARATLDIDRRISSSALITAGLNLATPGGDATWGVTAGVRASF